MTDYDDRLDVLQAEADLLGEQIRKLKWDIGELDDELYRQHVQEDGYFDPADDPEIHDDDTIDSLTDFDPRYRYNE